MLGIFPLVKSRFGMFMPLLARQFFRDQADDVALSGVDEEMTAVKRVERKRRSSKHAPRLEPFAWNLRIQAVHRAMVES